MARVRYTGGNNKPPTFNTDGKWDPDDFHLFDLDYWRDPEGGAGLGREIGQALGDAGQWIGSIPGRIKNYWQFDPGDNRNLFERYRDGFNVIRGASGALKEVYDATGQSEFAKRYWYIPDRPSQAALGATILQGAGEAIWGIKDWRKNWGGEAAPVTYQGNRANQAAYQYQPTPYVPAAGANLSNSDRLRIQQETLISNRKAQRLAELATAPDWVKQIYAPQLLQAPAQGYPQGGGGGYYQGPAQSLRQAQGNYQAQGYNPYAGRVDPSMRRGPNWERQHHKWVMLNRAARAKAGKG